VKAEIIAKALHGRRVGEAWIACCPAHKDRIPSLSISAGRDGKVLVRCHAGCEQRAVIAALQAHGLWQTTGQLLGIARRPPRRSAEEYDAEALRRSEAALGIWQASHDAKGTLVISYLRSRGLVVPASPALRFHAGLKHPSGGVWPAMVALVTHGATGSPIAVHRTFLASDGGRKAPVNPAKMMLGPCRGGVVRLADPINELMIGEGIETCLAAMQATGRAAWAALSTSGLRSLDLPTDLSEVIVLADGDEAGEAAAREGAFRWKRQGRRVRIARPPQGQDFNDMLGSRALSTEETAR
jgi:putative DNA primase/helicase